jgi:agmatine/peptidylarginine deiminase
MTFLRRPLNSMWMRDYGPVFTYDGSGNWAVTDFHYYRQRALDDSTPKYFSDLFQVPRVDRQSRENQVFTEGGNLMTDGLGTIVYSTRTYSNNSRVQPSVIDARIRSGLQAVKSIVPEDPSLDGTGHVDMFMKIIGSNTVVIGRYNPGQTDYQVLEDNAALFAKSTNGDGQPWNVIRVPQPDVYYVFFLFPVVRTYTNGLMINDQVIVPVYGLPEDATAMNIFANALPGRTIVPINANDIIEQAGAWHCVTMEYPAP